MENIKRQKIVERDEFTEEEKNRIAMKSDFRCCHCGKKAYFGYQASVEHFIPLSKGGTNRDINLVMLCKDCNKSKGNFIYAPRHYLDYLDEKYLDEIDKYFESYVQSFDFVNRDNVLACDRYKMMLDPIYLKNYMNYYHRKTFKEQDNFYQATWLKRATYDDIDKLTEYLIKYLRKYDCLDSEEAARINIEFWLDFGCIYYIELFNEIKCFVTVMVTKANGRVLVEDNNIEYFISMNLFSYYKNTKSDAIALGLVKAIPRFIMVEQEMYQIPVRICMAKKDTSNWIAHQGNKSYYNEDSRFISSFTVFYMREFEDQSQEKAIQSLTQINEDKKVNDFFKRFSNISEEKIRKWFEDHNQPVYEWMLNELELLKEEEPEKE